LILKYEYASGITEQKNLMMNSIPLRGAAIPSSLIQPALLYHRAVVVPVIVAKNIFQELRADLYYWSRTIALPF
jgi:hypothetical protein